MTPPDQLICGATPPPPERTTYRIHVPSAFVRYRTMMPASNGGGSAMTMATEPVPVRASDGCQPKTAGIVAGSDGMRFCLVKVFPQRIAPLLMV
ncbi:MAG: hypothetical protein HY830_17535 [Actinobacteria bacterium]|nr:hypothetical protein [Actinomycetota bacterium]